MNDHDYLMCLGTVTDALEKITDDIGEAPPMVFMVDDGKDDGLLCCAVDAENIKSPALVGQIDQMMAGRPKFAAMATRVHWATTEDGESLPTWLAVCVDPDRDASFLVRQDEEERWWQLKVEDVPWFAVSTAGSLRHSLQTGEPLHMKTATKEKPGIWQTPKHMPLPPPEDADGRI